jgi:hypothetical protein
MTLAVTIACLSPSGSTFEHTELRELLTSDRASVPGQYRTMLCDSTSGRVYVVAETNALCAKSNGSKCTVSARPEPSKVVYFQYLGRKAPYSHVVRQMEDQALSREERQRVREAYRTVQNPEDCKPSDHTSLSLNAYNRSPD